MKRLFLLLAFSVTVISCIAQQPSRVNGVNFRGFDTDLSVFEKAGDKATLYWNKTDKKFRVWDGTAWGDISAFYDYLDTAEIDFTLTGTDITADLIAGSIDETKLDASVNASLDLADSAIQVINPLQRNTIFLSTTGNDTTAEENDATLPFLTLDGAINHLLGEAHLGLNWTIETLDNGTYTQTVDDFVLWGYNIYNDTGATINIQSYHEVVHESIFNFPDGKLIFELTDDAWAATVKSKVTFHNKNTWLRQWDIDEMETINSSALNTNLERGVLRTQAADAKSYFRIGKWTVGANTWNFADDHNSGVEFTFYEIINNNGATNRGDEPFKGQEDLSDNLTIWKYTNTTTATNEIHAIKLTIKGDVLSDLAVTALGAEDIEITKDVTFENTSIIGTYGGSKRFYSEGGNKVTLDYDVATKFVIANQGIVKVASGYDDTAYTLLKNVNIHTDATSTLTEIYSSDLRAVSGDPTDTWRAGSTLILDNVELNLENDPVIYTINNYANISTASVNKNTGDYQLIMRNSVRIFNNNYIFSGGSPDPDIVPETFAVSEGASIWHDYDSLHSDPDFIQEYYNVNNSAIEETKEIIVACSNLINVITTGTAKAYFRMPYAMALKEVRVSLLDAGTTTGITVDINEDGTTVLHATDKLKTDATEETSETYSGTVANITDSALADDAEITIDFDAVPTDAKGVIVTLIGYKQ